VFGVDRISQARQLARLCKVLFLLYKQKTREVLAPTSCHDGTVYPGGTVMHFVLGGAAR